MSPAAEPAPADTAPLLVFSDDWGAHPSSCQHLIRCLLGRRDVTWVNTIGMRRPGLNRATVRRGWEKLRSWLPGSPAKPRNETTGPSPRVLSPKLWPSFGFAAERRLNRYLLRRQLTGSLGERPPIAVATTPVVADLIGHLPVAKWVYYCVDDFTTWPGLDHGAVARLEAKLIAGADTIIAVGGVLRDKIALHDRESALLPHGVDLDFWRSPATPPETIAHLPRPLVVFWGLIDGRMDVGFVKRLSEDMREGTLLFVGPSDCPSPELTRTPKVKLHPPVALAALPGVARAADALVMPYADLPVTRAMQPLKLKEYLATGLPVVARDLPANRDWADCLDLASTPEEFSAGVLRRVAEGLPDSQREARERLAAEGWQAKAREFERLLLDGVANGR